MRSLPLLLLMTLAYAVLADPGDIARVPLQTGVELRIEEIAGSRILPHAYHDQAVSSIPGVYPGSQILAKSRYFRLGKGANASFNSIVCYKQQSSEAAVTITGVSTVGTRAWRFEVDTNESLLPQTLIEVLAQISQLPLDLARQQRPHR